MPEHHSSLEGRQLTPSDPPQIIRAEPNILRLPFFALSTKGLKGIGGYECRGTINRGGKQYQFFFATERGAKSQYPGLLARKVHFALHSILTEQGFPFENPVSWTWADLHRRMGLPKSGRTIQRSKNAILTTAKLSIETRDAIRSHDKKTISTKVGQVTHLYDRVVLIDELMPDGTTADTNYLWFSDWYLQNLNSRYYAYLDHDLWKYLDDRSPIGSRLYEISLSKFSGTSVLNINYPTLAQLLPVTPERYFSQAQQQLAAAFKLTADVGILEKPHWLRRKSPTVAQLRIHPGKTLLEQLNQRPAVAIDETIADIEVRQIAVRPTSDPDTLVYQFYQDFRGIHRNPTKDETTQATDLIAKYGKANAAKYLKRAISQMKVSFPNAQRFGAAIDIIHEVAAHEAQGKRDRQRQSRQLKKLHEDEVKRQAEDRQWTDDMNASWQQLTETDRQAIRDNVLESNPIVARQYRKDPDSTMAHSMFLAELARRQPQPTE